MSSLFRHYKGGKYRVLFMATHHESNEPFVVYVPYDHPESGIRVREARDFFQPITWPDGSLRPRFVTEYQPPELLELGGEEHERKQE